MESGARDVLVIEGNSPLQDVRKHIAGMVERDSGLIVPESAVQEEKPEKELVREVWTNDELKLLNRVSKLLASRKMSFVLVCEDEPCKGQVFAELGHDEQGRVTLTCAGHKRRVFDRV